MGELRLYAIAIDEVRDMFGADDQHAERLRQIAREALTPAETTRAHGGLLTKLGPIFKRPPAALVISPTQPVPEDVEVLLAGAYVAPDRAGATWRVLEILVQGSAWGSVSTPLSDQSLGDLDFALARGGVSSSVGLAHLLHTSTSVNLLPVQGLTVGYHPYAKALAMADAYRAALPQIESPDQRELLTALIGWLEQFRSWSQVAASVGRPAPDLIGFWAS